MATQTIRILAFVTLLVHGIGHIQGVVAGTGIRPGNTLSTHSWLFSNLLGEKPTQTIALLIFLMTSIMGIATALSFQGWILPESLWTTLALITAFLSLFALIFFWNCFAMFFNKLGAIAVNVIIFYSILLEKHWPDALFNPSV